MLAGALLLLIFGWLSLYLGASLLREPKASEACLLLFPLYVASTSPVDHQHPSNELKAQ